MRAGEDSPRGLHEGPVGQSSLHHDRYGGGPERRGRGRAHPGRGDGWGPRGRMQSDLRPPFMGRRGELQNMPHPGRGAWPGEDHRGQRLPFHGDQPGIPPFPHHHVDGSPLPMPDLPQGPPMMGEHGPMPPSHFGQMGGPGPFGGGRGRGSGRGGPGDGFRRGALPLDPAMLERRRQSTTAIVQRQLRNIKVSETVAGQKAYAHYQRACSNESAGPAGPGPGKALWDEDPLKRFPIYSAVAAEESAFPVGRAQDPRDPFDIALEEYQAVPDSTLTIHQSKHGNFMGPSAWA
ncbi:hypothetical protein CVIRNUC_002992 [Coccomyxa viridis]|uniref:Uncharacterized protein n=1 Tax=Coccomyxa viridis TaxID=1274662 RepID=A0AAV1I0J2_9CHLO|nr:hypothetical protein CVIRNUC_002992 [Coccomyxa viridis]